LLFGANRFFVLVNRFLLVPLPAAVTGLTGLLVLLCACDTFFVSPPGHFGKVGQRHSADAGSLCPSVSSAKTMVANEVLKAIFATPLIERPSREFGGSFSKKNGWFKVS
jgi:hypothetical protein